MENYSQGIAPTIKPNRAHFNLSSRYTTAIDFDYLYPVFFEETLPGDTFSMNANIFGRFLTLLHPIMSNTYVDIHYFWAPTRILWDNARKFYGEQIDPA